MTGLSSRMAALRSPFASCGDDGITTLSPGACANHASSDCECCGPALSPPPVAARITTGIRYMPPNMYRALASWFTT